MLTRKWIFNIQLVILVAILSFFSVFIYNKVKDINITQKEIAALDKKIEYEKAYESSLTSEDHEKKNLEFIMQQGRLKLGLAMSDELLFIKEK